jgi:hypothetical protein
MSALTRKLSFLLACLLPMAAPAAEPDANAPYPLTIWAQATYDTAGRATEVSFPDKDDYPAPFLAGVDAVIRERTIEPRLLDGEPAVFGTGVMVQLTITPGAERGSVTVDSVEQSPRLLRRSPARVTQRLFETGWRATVKVTCTIAPNGRCGDMKFASDVAGMPSSVRAFAREWLSGWRFEPQTLNGEPIATEITIPFSLMAADPLPQMLNPI